MSKDESKDTDDREREAEDEEETESEQEEDASDEDEAEDGDDEEEEEEDDEASASGKGSDEEEEEDDDDESDSDEEEGDDEDEEDAAGDDEDDEEEEEEAAAAPAHPVSEDARAERARRRRELDHEEHGQPAEDDEDPTWWLPHAVLGVLVVIGVLGFFGVFNKALGFLAPAGAADTNKPVETASPTKPASQPATPPPPTGGADQAPREMFGAKHVLVMYKGSRRAPATIERTKEEAKKRAEEVLKKARAGTKFEDLVKEYSDEPNAAQRGGDLGQFPKGAMVPEFQAGLEKTKVGEISDVVETPFGFHVILRTK